ncbi:MAG: sensor histidine kinase, partial [Myxococcota bacterium]
RAADGAIVDFRVGDLNSAAAGQLGLPRDAVAGRHLSDAAEANLLRPLLPTLTEVATTRMPVQRPYSSPDGRRHYVLQVAPLRDGVGVTLRDVTEQREAEGHLRESEERYRLIVGQAPITFFAMDAAGNYLLADGRVYEGLGIDPRTLAGRSAKAVLARVPQGAALVERALAGEVAHGLVDWGHMIVKTHVSPIRDENGGVVGVTGVSVDVTDQVTAERELKVLTETLERRVEERTAELQAVNEELQAFAYSVAHDLRSPLRAMDGFAQVLLSTEGERLAPQSAAYLARIRANAQRMNELIDGLLKLSRVTRADLVRQTVDLSALARAIVSELRHQHHGREVDIRIAEGLWADGDLHLLRIALVNLFENAWKFTSTTPDARIVFERAERDGKLVFVMRDNGVGFSMEHAEQLFGAFQRLHPREAFEGTGIGLATVKRIVTRHGGEVWAEGAPGEGASFYFTLSGGR